jgi:hypothetical protein
MLGSKIESQFHTMRLWRMISTTRPVTLSMVSAPQMPLNTARYVDTEYR